MNPALLIIIAVGCVVGWALLSGAYKAVGGMVKDVAEDAVNEMKEDEDE